MAQFLDCRDSSQLLTSIRAAREAIKLGQLVVLPTDTVYGVAADAFSPEAVARLLAAKGRGRQSPPPVLISGISQLDALAEQVPAEVRTLVEAFWPGALTVVLSANPSLSWDLGDAMGSVALRVPDDEFTLELLRETGPLAVSSANKTAHPAAVTIAEAHDMLGDTVAVYLDGGTARPDRAPSTIVDATALTGDDGQLRILREGRIAIEELRATLPGVTIVK